VEAAGWASPGGAAAAAAAAAALVPVGEVEVAVLR